MGLARNERETTNTADDFGANGLQADRVIQHLGRDTEFHARLTAALGASRAGFDGLRIGHQQTLYNRHTERNERSQPD